MKTINYLLFLLVFILTCTLIVCTGQQVQIKDEEAVKEEIVEAVVKEEVDCSQLFEKAKDLLIEGQKNWIGENEHVLENAEISFSENYKCVTKNIVIFGVLISIRYFDTDVNKFLCAELSIDVLVDDTDDKINFDFGNLVVQSLEVCEDKK